MKRIVSMLALGGIFALAGCESGVSPSDASRYRVLTTDVRELEEDIGQIETNLERLADEVNALREAVSAESGAETELGSE